MAQRPRPFVTEMHRRAAGRRAGRSDQGSRWRSADTRRSGPFPAMRTEQAAGRMGMLLFLVSVGMLFAATVIATLAIRFAPGSEHPWHGLDLPWELGLSTILLAAASLACERALRRIRRGDRRGLYRWLSATLAIGLAFLLAQAWSWAAIVRSIEWTEVIHARTLALAAWLVVVLTVVHALHVVGGIVPLAIVRRRSAAGRYTASQHAGVEHVRTYWHFLGVVWVVLLATLLVALPA